MGTDRVWFDDDRGAAAFRLRSGVPVYLHLTFVLPVAVMATILFLSSPRHGLVLALLAGPTIFATVLLHEVAHMLVARRDGIPAKAIHIFDTGGLVELALPPGTHRLWHVSLAGPAVNILIGAALLLLRLAMPEPVPVVDPRWSVPPPAPPGLMDVILFHAGWFNVLVGAANLLPAYPLDGGAILEEWLLPVMGPRRSEFVVGCLGLGCAVLSTLFFILSALAGIALWLPPSFAPQWAAIFQERLDPSAPDRGHDEPGVPGRSSPLPGWLGHRSDG